MTRPRALLLLLGLSACHNPSRAPASAASPSLQAAPAAASPVEPPAPRFVALPVAPLDATGAASAGTVALARGADRTLAFVADADDRAIVTFDVSSMTKLASTPLGARPSAVLVTRGSRVVALGADDARLHVLALVAADEPLVEDRTIAVPEEPVSAAMVPGADTLLVASRWGHALSVVPLEPEQAPRVINLPRDPAAVVASADGRWALVSHAVGSRASVVPLEAAAEARSVPLNRHVERSVVTVFEEMPEPMPVPHKPELRAASRAIQKVTLHADQTFAALQSAEGRIFAPEVLVDTGPAHASGGYGGGGAEASVSPAVVAFDGATGELEAPGGERTLGTRCLLPRGAAFDDASHTMLVTCMGTDSVVALAVSAKAIRLERIVPVAKGPTGVAVDAEGRRAVVWSAFNRVVSVMALGDAPKVTGKQSLPRQAEAPLQDVERGRALFHAAFDARVSSDGRACASCHPDGRDDSLTWSSPNGPSQTPILFARLEGTAPYGWDGASKTLAQHLSRTTQRLGGSGLSARDVRDLGAYLASVSAPGRADPADPTVVARGAEVFRSAGAECASCHAGSVLTDGETHDVESQVPVDRVRAFDTPSLRFVSRSAPYFHDGRYASLGDMLEATQATMGHTSQLSPEDRGALEAYLKTL